MFIRKMENNDIAGCAEILCAVYNNELWMCRWNKETAIEYLNDFFHNKKFVGYVAEENGNLIAGLFAHEKIWWNNSEVFIEEMFVNPEYQGKGIGTSLLLEVEKYIKEKGLAGITCLQINTHLLQSFTRRMALQSAGMLFSWQKRLKNRTADNRYLMEG